jgi:hypothetical protein
VDVEEKSGLFYATSPEIKGLFIAKYSRQEVEDAVPSMVQDLFAACGVSAAVTKIDQSWIVRIATPRSASQRPAPLRNATQRNEMQMDDREQLRDKAIMAMIAGYWSVWESPTRTSATVDEMMTVAFDALHGIVRVVPLDAPVASCRDLTNE